MRPGQFIQPFFMTARKLDEFIDPLVRLFRGSRERAQSLVVFARRPVVLARHLQKRGGELFESR